MGFIPGFMVPCLICERRIPTAQPARAIDENQIEHASESDHALSVMRPSLLLLLGLLAVIACASISRAAEPTPPQPSLVLVLTIDQFRGDYLNRFREHFVPGGLKLLLEGGAHFVD